MAASATDLLRKLARRFVTQVGSGGVTDASTTTGPLSSTTGLPTDTAVDITFDRVDADGVATSSLEETVTGVVSGSNLTDMLRAQEGTAQAHTAGKVAEQLFNAITWNDHIDAHLVIQNQDGTLKSGIVLTVPQVNDTSSDHQYIFGVSELTADRTVTLPLLTGNDTFVFQAHTQTLTNKRVTPRETTEASSATPTINTDNTDIHTITALATNITSFTTNLSGTPTDGQKLIIRIQDSGSGQTIAWGASFASAGATLPTSITAGKKAYVGLIWNADDSVFDCIAAIEEA